MPNMGLVIVDPLNDFMPDGALPVPEGDQIVPVLVRLLKHFTADATFVVQDDHPETHKSFASNHEGKNVFDVIELHGIPQVLWPDHCKQGTDGQAIHKDLLEALPKGVAVVKKGMDPEYDSYSGVKDAGGKRTGLVELMKAKGIDTGALVYVGGLATDYCVKATVLDLRAEGYEVRVVVEGIKGVGAQPGDVGKALAEMHDAGAEFVSIDGIGIPLKFEDL